MGLVPFVGWVIVFSTLAFSIGYCLGKAHAEPEPLYIKFMCCDHCDNGLSWDSLHYNEKTDIYEYNNHLVPCVESDCKEGSRVSTERISQGYRNVKSRHKSG